MKTYLESLTFDYLYTLGNCRHLPLEGKDEIAQKLYILNNHILLREFKKREDHKKYLVLINEVLNKIDNTAAAAFRKLENIIQKIYKLEARSIGYKGNYNGFSSRAIEKKYNEEQDKDVKAKLQKAEKKPFGAYTFEDLASS